MLPDRFLKSLRLPALLLALLLGPAARSSAACTLTSATLWTNYDDQGWLYINGTLVDSCLNNSCYNVVHGPLAISTALINATGDNVIAVEYAGTDIGVDYGAYLLQLNFS